MSVPVRSKQIVRLESTKFNLCLSGKLSSLRNDEKYNKGLLYIKEMSKGFYTGREIITQITHVNDNQIKFRKLHISIDKDLIWKTKRQKRMKNHV